MFNLNRQTENLLAFLAQAQRARATEYGERGFRFVDLNARDAATTSTNLSKKFEVRYCLTCGKIVTYPWFRAARGTFRHATSRSRYRGCGSGACSGITTGASPREMNLGV